MCLAACLLIRCLLLGGLATRKDSWAALVESESGTRLVGVLLYPVRPLLQVLGATSASCGLEDIGRDCLWGDCFRRYPADALAAWLME